MVAARTDDRPPDSATPPGDSRRAARVAALEAAAARRVLVLDGAMGTMIQRHELGEADFRGTLYADHDRELAGNNDLLSLTRPEVIRDIHAGFLDAGADIVTTNTFNANRVSQEDYGLGGAVRALNLASARIACEAADAAATAERPRFVAGVLGPTNMTLSVSPDVNDPGKRTIDFATLGAAYREAAEALIEGGVDLILLETIFDSLNAKAALVALDEMFEASGTRLPILISGTVTNRAGRMLNGQTVEAFWLTLAHAAPFSVGLNCSFGAADMRPHLADLARIAETRVSAYPNAGLPNEFGGYDETPDETAAQLGEWAEAGLAAADIIFDPNIFAVATGIEEHNDYARAFIEAAREIKIRWPEVHVSGGVSNISFAFRGNNTVREAMHAAFLYHAAGAGMDMGIVNAGQLAVYEDIPNALRDAVEDVLLNRRPDATERLLESHLQNSQARSAFPESPS